MLTVRHVARLGVPPICPEPLHERLGDLPLQCGEASAALDVFGPGAHYAHPLGGCGGPVGDGEGGRQSPYGRHLTERVHLPLDVDTRLFETRMLLAVQAGRPQNRPGRVALRGLWTDAMLREDLPLDGKGRGRHRHVHVLRCPLRERGLACGLLDPFGHDGERIA